MRDELVEALTTGETSFLRDTHPFEEFRRQIIPALAHMVRQRLEMTEARLPLACVLEGGTWAAGREMAQRLRGGLPPLKVASDGTVF